MTDATRRTLLYIVIVVLAGIVLCVAVAATASAATASAAPTSAAPTDTCDPAYTAQCCGCEPSNVAEPQPLPQLYLPAVQRDMPGMAAEYTPAQPVATVTPEMAVTGDVQ